jgi:hypothetical protein
MTVDADRFSRYNVVYRFPNQLLGNIFSIRRSSHIQKIMEFGDQKDFRLGDDFSAVVVKL